VIPFEWLQKNWVFVRAARICVPSPRISGRAFRFRSPYAGQPGDRQRFAFGRRAVSVSRVGSGEDALGVVIDLKVDGERSHDELLGMKNCRRRFTRATPRARANGARSTRWRTTKKPCGVTRFDGWRGLAACQLAVPLGPLAPDRPQARRAASKSRKDSPTRPPLGGAAACRGGVRP
jgi:hypothetical protein